MAEVLYMIELRKISSNTENTVKALKALEQQVAQLNVTMAKLAAALENKSPRDS
jgi:hypothetical protein